MTLNPFTTLTLNPITLTLQPQRKILVFAQGLGSGFVSGQVYTNVDSSYDINGVFGSGSHAALACHAINAVMDWIGNSIQFDVLPVSDNVSGVAATSDFIVGGTNASEAKTLKITIGTKEGINNEIIYHNTYSIPVAINDTPTIVASAIETIVNADVNALVSTVATTGTLAMTAKNKGTEGNEILIELEGTVAGLTFTLNPFASGATDPDLTNVLDIINEERYDIICNYAFLSSVKSHLENKFNVVNDILDGVSFTQKVDTYSNFTADSTGFLAPEVNISKTSIIFTNNKISTATKKGGSLPVFNIVAMSIFAAYRALRLTENSLISKFMQAGNTRGGIGIEVVPYFNMTFPMLNIIPVGENWNRSQLQVLKNLGGSYWDISNDRSTILSGEVSTLAYKASNLTAIGKTYHWLNNTDAFTTSRAYFQINLKSKFSQSRLYDGDLPINSSGRQIQSVNKLVFENYLLKLWIDLVDYGILQGGVENREEFLYNINIIVSTANGSITGSFLIRIAGQLREINLDINTKL